MEDQIEAIANAVMELAAGAQATATTVLQLQANIPIWHLAETYLASI